MPAATQQDKVKTQNEVHYAQIWRQTVNYELHTANVWESHWGFMRDTLANPKRVVLPPIVKKSEGVDARVFVKDRRVEDCLMSYNTKQILTRDTPSKKYKVCLYVI
jgi:hypothetical protein